MIPNKKAGHELNVLKDRQTNRERQTLGEKILKKEIKLRKREREREREKENIQVFAEKKMTIKEVKRGKRKILKRRFI